MKEGKLIVIEGGDGSGKQMQTAMLVKRLRKLNRPVETIDFPQYETTLAGKIIRAYLNGQFGEPVAINPLVVGMIYCLDRFECAPIIQRWLRDGKIVVADRYHSANIIHQGAKIDDPAKRKEMKKRLEDFEFLFLHVPFPTAIVYLHVYPEVAQKLMKKQGRAKDGHESDFNYARKVEQTALWACRKFGWKKIECCPDKKSILPPEQIHEMIWDAVKDIVHGSLA